MFLGLGMYVGELMFRLFFQEHTHSSHGMGIVWLRIYFVVDDPVDNNMLGQLACC